MHVGGALRLIKSKSDLQSVVMKSERSLGISLRILLATSGIGCFSGSSGVNAENAGGSRRRVLSACLQSQR